MTETKGSKRYFGPRPLSGLMLKSVTPSLRKRGFGVTEIVTKWPEIVGQTLAQACVPEKLSFPRNERRNGVLQIRVAGALALELQHLQPVILDRINLYFGYTAVSRINLIHGKVSLPEKAKPKPAAPALSAEEISEIDSQTGAISDDALKQALRNLGKSVKSREKQRKKRR